MNISEIYEILDQFLHKKNNQKLRIEKVLTDPYESIGNSGLTQSLFRKNLFPAEC